MRTSKNILNAAAKFKKLGRKQEENPAEELYQIALNHYNVSELEPETADVIKELIYEIDHILRNESGETEMSGPLTQFDSELVGGMEPEIPPPPKVPTF